MSNRGGEIIKTREEDPGWESHRFISGSPNEMTLPDKKGTERVETAGDQWRDSGNALHSSSNCWAADKIKTAITISASIFTHPAEWSGGTR